MHFNIEKNIKHYIIKKHKNIYKENCQVWHVLYYEFFLVWCESNAEFILADSVLDWDA